MPNGDEHTAAERGTPVTAMRGASPDVQLTVPAEPEQLSPLRQLTAEFAERHGARNQARDDIVIAVNEACSNVVRHAYGPAGGPLHLEATVDQETITFVVSDQGTKSTDPIAGAGFGLGMIHQLADDVIIHGPGPNGTQVRLAFSLNGHPRSPMTI